MAQTLPRIDPGKRALLAGSTGSGKSTLACWLLIHSPGRWIILNPKHTKAYNSLPDSVIVPSLNMDKIEREMMHHRFVIVNPNSAESDPDVMDAFIMSLHEGWKNIGLCCDELYTLHKGGVAGKGLLGWLTRGRELKQSFLGLTQRPVYISKFLFSESDYLSSMKLRLQADRKRFVEMTDNKNFMRELPKRQWFWLDTDTYDFNLYGAVPID